MDQSKLYQIGDIFKVTDPVRYYQVLEILTDGYIISYIGPGRANSTSSKRIRVFSISGISVSRSEVILYCNPVL